MGKKSFREVPDSVRKQITDLATDAFQVGAALRLHKSELKQPQWADLGIRIESDGSVSVPSRIVPDPSRGRYSLWNANGREIVRRDLPKTTKDFGWYAPNFHDTGNHWISRTREVWQREIRHGLQLPLLMAIREVKGQEVVIGFAIEQVFDRANGFEDLELVFALSLLQANVGSSGVVPADRELSAWLADQHVSWEILPVGEWPSALIRIGNQVGTARPGPRSREVQDRLGAVAALKPEGLILGSSGFTRYVGFRFRDDLVVFENSEYGNALYVMFEEWEQLCQLPRTELLRNAPAGYTKIPHTKGWKDRLHRVLKSNGH